MGDSWLKGCGSVGQRRMGPSNRELGGGSLQREWGQGRSQGQCWYWDVQQVKELGLPKGTGVTGAGWGVAKKRKGVGEIGGVWLGWWVFKGIYEDQGL